MANSEYILDRALAVQEHDSFLEYTRDVPSKGERCADDAQPHLILDDHPSEPAADVAGGTDILWSSWQHRPTRRSSACHQCKHERQRPISLQLAVGILHA